MGAIISVANQKGGVTKTTSAYNLSAALALMGKSVLMIDFDPQASLTLSAGYDPLDFDKTICDVLKDGDVRDCIYDVSDIKGLKLIPSITSLASVELGLIQRMAREYRLKKAIDGIKDKFDYIFIDCPPQLSLLTLNAFAACDYVLIPCETATLAYYALEELKVTIKGVKEELNGDIKILGVIATLYDMRTNLDNKILGVLKENYKVLGIIKKSVSAKKGLELGLPVVVFDPKQDIAKEYTSIAEKIVSATTVKG